MKPSSTTPVIPGSRISWLLSTRSQIEVPITITKVPGRWTPTAGSATKASTLPIATVTSVVSSSRSAIDGASLPADVPGAKNLEPSFSKGCGNPGNAASKYSCWGTPSLADQHAL